MIKESMNLCMQLLTILTTIIAMYFAFRKMLNNVMAPIILRLDASEKKNEIRAKENKVMFKSFRVMLMKLQGEHINGDMAEVIQRIDDCLIDNLH